MAKSVEKATARQLFMKGEDQKQIAALVQVSEKTITKWARDGDWKRQREAMLTGHQSRMENLKELIGIISERRIKLQEEIDMAKADKDLDKLEELRKEANQLANEVGMYSKSLDTIDKENKVPLATYLQIMDEIFQALRKKDPKLWNKTIDFQNDHLDKISLKYQ